MNSGSGTPFSPFGAQSVSMLCPWCLRLVAGFTYEEAPQGVVWSCPDCHQIVPQAYIWDYTSHGPATFTIIGYRGQGKTVFIQALFHELTNAAYRGGTLNWPGFSFSASDPRMMVRIKDILKALRAKSLPAATDQFFYEPAILKLTQVPGIGSRQLLAFDTSGELLSDLNNLKAYGSANQSYIARVPTVVLLATWQQLNKAEEARYGLDGLLSIYQDALIALGGNPKEQNLLVVVSKADRLVDEDDTVVPRAIKEFLRPNPRHKGVHELGDADHWIRLGALSEEIEHWLEGQRGFGGFVREARENFRRVEYCVVSAIGHEPEEPATAGAPATLKVDIAPRGVLSTLLWVLRLQSVNPAEELRHQADLARWRKLLNSENVTQTCRTPQLLARRDEALRQLNSGRGREFLARQFMAAFQRARQNPRN